MNNSLFASKFAGMSKDEVWKHAQDVFDKHVHSHSNPVIRNYDDVERTLNEVLVVTETEIVQRARIVIFDALKPSISHLTDEKVFRVELAKWVIENIWTPDVDKDAA